MVFWTEIGAALPPVGFSYTAADTANSTDSDGGASNWHTSINVYSENGDSSSHLDSGSDESYQRSGLTSYDSSTSDTRGQRSAATYFTSTENGGVGQVWFTSDETPSGYTVTGGYSYSWTSLRSESYSFTQVFTTAQTGTGSTAVFDYSTTTYSSESSTSGSFSTIVSYNNPTTWDTGEAPSYVQESTVLETYERTFLTWIGTTTEGTVVSASTFTQSVGNSLSSWVTTSQNTFATTVEVQWRMGSSSSEPAGYIIVTSTLVEGVLYYNATVSHIVPDHCSVLYTCGLQGETPVKACSVFSSTDEIIQTLGFGITSEVGVGDTWGRTDNSWTIDETPVVSGFPSFGFVEGYVVVPHPGTMTITTTYEGGGSGTVVLHPHQHYSAMGIADNYYGSYSIECPETISDLDSSSSDLRTQGTTYNRAGIRQVLTLNSEDTLIMSIQITATVARSAAGGYGAITGDNTVVLVGPGIIEYTAASAGGSSSSGESTITDTDYFDTTACSHPLARGNLFAWQNLSCVYGDTFEYSYTSPYSILESSC